MKKFALLLTVVGVVSILPAPLAAQSFRMTARIPFNFVIDGKAVPAGEYTVEAGTIAPGVLLVRNAACTVNVATLGDPLSSHDAAGKDEPQLRFDRYGDRYFLSQAWPGLEENGIELNVSGHELSAAKERAAIRPESVVVAATR